MTGMQIQSAVIKDILTGILLYMLIIAGMYMIPLTGVAAWLFLPLPVLFYRLKTGRKGGIIIMLTSLAILMLVTRNIAMVTLYFGPGIFILTRRGINDIENSFYAILGRQVLHCY